MLGSDRDVAFAFEYEVELVPAGVSVELVLLAGLEAVEAGEEVLRESEIGFAHFVGLELGFGGGVVEDHVYRPSRAGSCGWATHR
jgi:hypothetical protein